MGGIIIVLLSEISERIPAVLERSLEQTFDRVVQTRAKIRSLDNAYDPSRNQHVSPEASGAVAAN